MSKIMFLSMSFGICVLLAVIAQGESVNHESNKLEKVEINSKFGETQKSNENGEDGLGISGKVTMKKRWVFRRVEAEAHSLEGEPLPDPEDEEEEEDSGPELEEEEEAIDEDDPEELAIHQKPIIPEDESHFPSDCAILYKVTADFESRKADEDSQGPAPDQPSTVAVVVFTIVGLLLKVLLY